jgi:Leucine-rich repeat (LRR) protein
MQFLIHPSFIEKFPNVVELTISGDFNAKLVISNPVENCQNITTMYLSNLDLLEVDNRFFARCINLNDIMFYRTSIGLSENLFPDRLKILHFDGNTFGDLREAYFKNLNKLGYLTFRDCSFKSLIEETVFNGLKKLKLLSIEASKMPFIPPHLFDPLENLEELIFGSTNLKFVNETFLSSLRTLAKLQYLNLYETFIELSPGSFDGLGSLGVIYLVSNDITTLIEKAFGDLKGIEYLHLSENLIQEIQLNAFQGCSHLTDLYLNGNKLRSLEGHEFKHLNNLEILDLTKNSIARIHSNAFKEAKQLSQILLSNNQLEAINPGMFRQNFKLKSLDLENNKIMAIHSKTFDVLPIIKSLVLRGNVCINSNFLASPSNDFTTFKKALTYCFKRFEEKFVYCNYRKIQTEYCCFSEGADNRMSTHLKMIGNHLPGMSNQNVTCAIFSDSNLFEIPLEIFATFGNLKTLKMESVNLESINKLENCSNFERFVGSFNNLQVLDGSFRNCRKLLDIDLSFNQIDSIVGSPFKYLGKLERVDLEFNRLAKIDSNAFKNCRSLLYLNLDHNRLEFIADDAFKDMIDLRELYLKANYRLTYLDPRSFQQLIHLEKLHLNANQIKNLENFTFENLKNLKEINLSQTPLTVLNEKIFRGNFNLEKIFIYFNNISKIHPQAFHGLHNLKQLKLTGNVCVNGNFEILDGNLEEIMNDLSACFRNYYPNEGCSFSKNDRDYICLYENITVRENQNFTVHGYHLQNKSDSDVTRVEFISSNLSKIPSEIFIAFENLAYLNVESSGLLTIKPLKNCKKLREFKGSHNNIERLNPRIFAECFNLQFIELSANKIRKLPANIFQLNSQLISIDLSQNSINGIAPCEKFQGFKYLNWVDFSGNKCIDSFVQIKNVDVKKIRELLSFCYSSWLLDSIMVEEKNDEF